MKNWKDIPIPQLMLDLERDPRGLPVPYVVLKTKDGKHHFKINDSEKTINCMLEFKCTICGQTMKKSERWLVGGIASAFDPKGYYTDHPIHHECGQYALQVCPYMAIKNYSSKLDLDKLQSQMQGTVLHNPTIDQDRLPLFVFIKPSNIVYGHTVSGDLAVVPRKPYYDMEFWCDGEQILRNEDIEDKLTGTKWEKYMEDIYNLQNQIR